MNKDENAMPQPVFMSTERVHIANLHPQHNNGTSCAYIDAQIALVWPYSSSTRQFAFLLSEPDVRPLKSRRQVKVTFYNGAARAVQAAKVGIGDQIKLPLHGCQWQALEDASATPGKRVQWDLAYRKAISLEISPSSSGEVQTVQYESTGTPSPRNSILSNGTVPSSNVDNLADPPQLPVSVETPVSIRRNGFHTLGSTPDDPFLDDLEQESGRRRKRTKFARASGAWTLLDNDHEASPRSPTSPLASLRSEHENEPLSRVIHASQAETENSVTDAVASQVESVQEDEVSQPPQQKPLPAEGEGASVQATQSDERTELEIESIQSMRPPEPPPRSAHSMKLQLPSESVIHIDERANTPRLHPLASPSLPLISPLIKRTGVETGYFPSPFEASSELDAISQSGFNEQTKPIEEVAVSEHDEVVIVEESGRVVDNATPHVSAIGAHLAAEIQSVEPGNDSLMTDAQEQVPIGRESADTEPAQVPVSEAAATALRNEANIAPFLPRPETTGAKQWTQDSEKEIVPSKSSSPLQAEAHRLNETETSLLVEVAEKIETEQAAHPVEEATVDEELLSSDAQSHEVLLKDLPRSPKPSSPIQLVDGAVDSHDHEVPGHVRLLQGEFEYQQAHILDSVTPPLSSLPEPVTEETAPAPKIALQQADISSSQSQPGPEDIGVDEFAPTSNNSIKLADQEQLLTPAQTQEQPETALVDPPHTYNGNLLTPQATQDDRGELAIGRVITSAKPSTQRLTDNEAMSVEVISPRSHRGSQRLSRKSNTTVAVESPFFSSRKNPKEAIDETSPVQETPVLHKSQAKQSKLPEVESLGFAGSACSKGKQVASQIGTTTNLAYYPSFTQLHEYYGQTVDVIAVCAEPSTQAVKSKSGPRDWHTSLRLVDPEDTAAKITVQTFRPYKDALPSANVGDVIILRQFKVQTAKHKWQLLSTDASAWAVFRPNPDSRAMFDKVDMTGPQLEYGRGETARVKELVRWWSERGGAISALAEKDKDNSTNNPSLHATNNERPTEEAEVLQSVEQPPSPRRLRRKQHEASGEPDDSTSQDNTSAEQAIIRASVTPQPTRHQPPRRARTKTPNPQVHPAAAPSSSPRASINDKSSLPPPSPTRTRRRTRSILSPAATSIVGAASTSAASSVAATSPTEATFAAPTRSAESSGNKGKGRAKREAQAKGRSTPQITPSGDDAQGEEGNEDDEEENVDRDGGTSPQQQQQQKRSHRRSSAATAAGPPLVHELRDGMRYVDEPDSEAVQKRVTRSQVHELRDGVRYVDEP